jgi:hypothetical protein
VSSPFHVAPRNLSRFKSLIGNDAHLDFADVCESRKIDFGGRGGHSVRQHLPGLAAVAAALGLAGELPTGINGAFSLRSDWRQPVVS